MKGDIEREVPVVRYAYIDVENIREFLANKVRSLALRFITSTAERRPSFRSMIRRDDGHGDTLTEPMDIKERSFTYRPGIWQPYFIKGYRVYGMVSELGLHTR